MITKLSDIQLRDPFIVNENGKYYMFGSTDKDIWHEGTGFDYYESAGNVDNPLSHFEGPRPAWRPDSGFWSASNFWAAEVHRYNGNYYLFATFLPKKDSPYHHRGSAILKSEGGVTGPYAPHSAGPLTPPDWECLDGTLFVEDGAPYMVFCHEWQQVGDGEICAVRLTSDLRASVGEPSLLFRASEASWAFPLKNRAPGSYVTDGPFLWHGTKSLFMLWSSFGEDGKYCLGYARSENGSLFGRWAQCEKPLFAEDGGHGMIFRTHDGNLRLALHSPNKTPSERPLFFTLLDSGQELELGGALL